MKNYQEIAYVRFVEGMNTKQYRFAVYDGVVKEGDRALVKSGGYGFGVVQVEKVIPVNECTDALPTAEIVCRLDMVDYENRCRTRKEHKKAKVKLRNMVNEPYLLVAYQAAAAANPEIVPVLEQYIATMNV